MSGMMARCVITAALAFAAVPGATARAEDGRQRGPIVFGQPAALDGPAAASARACAQGSLAAFAEANRGRRRQGPQARTDLGRRRLRADQIDRGDQEAAR